MRGIKARGTGGSTTGSSGMTTTQVTADAAPHSVYMNEPGGVYDPVTDRTYVAYLGLERDLYVTYYDHQAGTVATPVEVATYPIADDDNHGGPAVAVDLDGHVHVVWGSHNSGHQHSRTDSPHDITAWSTQSLTTAGTYPSIAVDPSTGDLYVVDRSGSGHGSSFPAHEFAGLRKSTDNGATWSAAAAIIDTTGSPESASDVYFGGCRFGDDGRLHMCWTVARGASHGGDRTNVYHAAYDPDDGRCYTADGTDLGTVVTWAEHSDCLAATRSPLFAVQLTLNGDRIHLAYGQDDAGTATDHFVATWDGASWSESDTGVSGPYFGKEMIWVHSDGSLRGLFPTTNGSFGDLVVYGSDDDGATWFEIATLASGASGDGYGPVSPIIGPGPSVALAMEDPENRASTSATASDLLPILMVRDPRAVRHTHDDRYYTQDETYTQAEVDAAIAGITITREGWTLVESAQQDGFADTTDAGAILAVYRWGVDGSGNPYFDSSGVTSGEEAALWLNDNDEYALVELDL